MTGARSRPELARGILDSGWAPPEQVSRSGDNKGLVASRHRVYTAPVCAYRLCSSVDADQSRPSVLAIFSVYWLKFSTCPPPAK